MNVDLSRKPQPFCSGFYCSNLLEPGPSEISLDPSSFRRQANAARGECALHAGREDGTVADTCDFEGNLRWVVCCNCHLT